ncbi:MAG: hypothetical protein ACFCU6_05745, partial [Balneolaceae bacterium]
MWPSRFPAGFPGILYGMKGDKWYHEGILPTSHSSRDNVKISFIKQYMNSKFRISVQQSSLQKGYVQ